MPEQNNVIRSLAHMKWDCKLEWYENRTPKEQRGGRGRRKMDKIQCRIENRCAEAGRKKSGSAQPVSSWSYPPKPSITGGGKNGEVRGLIFRWIETYYNRRRRNTANEGNLTPLVKRARIAQCAPAA